MVSRLEELQAKYQTTGTQTESSKAFESQIGSKAAGPKIETLSVGQHSRDMAEIKMDLADLAEQYGELNVNFANLIGKDAMYNLGDLGKLAWYTATFQDGKKKQVRLDAVGRKGNTLETLVNKMSNILEDQHQKAKDGKARAYEVQASVVAHISYLDQKLVDSLRTSHTSTADLTTAEQEATRIQTELEEINGVLNDYRKDVSKARDEGQTEEVYKLTDEMNKVVEMKRALLEGRLSADGMVSEIRRELLDKTEGIQSSIGAAAASRVNYQAANALIDAMNELEIKYRHARSDMLPVLKQQAMIGDATEMGLKLRETITRVAGVSNDLMNANATLVTKLAQETFDLLQTPLYDPAVAQEAEDRIRNYMTQLNEQKKEWVEAQKELGVTTDSAYATH